jgi:hypothetical protein
MKSAVTLRHRKTWRTTRHRMTKAELLQGLRLLLLIVIILIIGLYLGWWTLEQEEKQERQESSMPAVHR